MIKDYKNSIAALLDEGYLIEDLHDMLSAAKAEYDKAHRVALVDELLAIFDAYGVHMTREPLSKFVNMSADELENFVSKDCTVVKSTEEKCNCTNTKPCDEKIVLKPFNGTSHQHPLFGKFTVKTNAGDPDEIIKDWMKTLGF